MRVPAWHGLGGVENEVLHDLGDLPPVGMGGPEVVGQLEFDFGGKSREGECSDFRDDLLERDGAEDRIAALGEGEQLLGEVAGPQGRAAGGLEVFGHLRIEGTFQCRQRVMTDDDGQ